MGIQAIKVAEDSPGLQVWAKPMSKSGERAVVLLNRTAKAAPIAVRWKSIGLLSQGNADVTDVWADKNLGIHHSQYTAIVPPEDVDMSIISGDAATPILYRPAIVENEGCTATACVQEEGRCNTGSALRVDSR